MTCTKGWIGAALVAAAAGASAQTSFELLFVADRGTRSVHRFDPMTGQHLGEIGKGLLTDAQDVAVDASRGEVHVHENGGRILRFDYSTGLYKGGWNVMGGAIGFHRSQNGEYLAWTSNRLSRYSSTGSLVANYDMPSGLTIRGADIAANGGAGFLYVGTRDANQTQSTRRWNLATGVNDLNQFWYTDRVVYRGNVAINAIQVFNVREIETDISTDSGILGARFANVSTLASRLGQPSWGHAYPGTLGLGYIPARNAANTGGLVIRYDADTGAVRGTFGESRLIDPVGSATVLAPEPGTMIALGAGLAAIAARRRRRA